MNIRVRTPSARYEPGFAYDMKIIWQNSSIQTTYCVHRSKCFILAKEKLK